MKKIDETKFTKALLNGKDVKITIHDKSYHIIVKAPESNEYQTKYSIDVEYWEPNDKYPHYSYVVSEPSKQKAIESIIVRLKEHKFNFKNK